jgi:hypothetical protein
VTGAVEEAEWRVVVVMQVLGSSGITDRQPHLTDGGFRIRRPVRVHRWSIGNRIAQRTIAGWACPVPEHTPLDHAFTIFLC